MSESFWGLETLVGIGGFPVAPSRQKEPMDIMGALLNGKAPKITTEENDIIERLAFYLRRLEHRNGFETAHEPQAFTARPKDSRPKKKVTYYLTKLIIQHLEKAQEKLAEADPEGLRPKISKSVIVETALRTALQELDAKGPKSRLFRMLQDVCRRAKEARSIGMTKPGEEVP